MIGSPIGLRPTSAWYQLRYTQGGLFIRIHQSVANTVLEPITRTWEPAQLLASYLSLPSFIPPDKEAWGFGPILHRAQDASSWRTWFMKWPTLPQDENQRWEQKELFCISATLNLLFNELLKGKSSKWLTEPRGTLPQLLDIHYLQTSPEPGGGTLGVTLSPIVGAWVASLPDSTCHAELGDALFHAYHRLTGTQSDADRRSCHVYVEHPRWLTFSIPGSESGLHPDEQSSENPERGYSLVSHNVDDRVQQITLLAGLAKLNDLVRAWQQKP